MSCNSIPSSSSPITFDVQYFMSSQCFQCEDSGCSATYNSKCVYYLGPNLTCSGIETGETVEVAIQKIDAQICSAIGDYSSYQFHCLTAWFGETITQESQFVDAITAYACEITETLEQFTGVTFPAFQSEIESDIEDIATPTITCVSAGVTSLDSLQTILTKYCTKFGQIDTAISISGVDWDECLTVVSPPTTIAGAFSLVVDQICQVAALTGAALPTFNNLSTCLASPGAADSLISTVGKIITRLCLSPTYDGDNITWGCVEEPADNESIEDGIQNIITGLNTSLQALPTFDGGDFTVTATNPSDPCAGVTVALATPLNQDRFVAATASDASPSTLQGKITAGTNITLDFVTTPGQMIINGATTALDYKVKASSGDTSPDFLDQKLDGSSAAGITVSPIYNAFTEKVDITLSVNESTLLDLLLDELIPGTALYDKFCEKVALCPCNCGTSDCIQYLIENESGLTQSVSYRDCVSGSTIPVSLPDGSGMVVCAQAGSVSAGSCTVTAVQSCAGGTTSSTTSTTTTPP